MTVFLGSKVSWPGVASELQDDPDVLPLRGGTDERGLETIRTEHLISIFEERVMKRILNLHSLRVLQTSHRSLVLTIMMIFSYHQTTPRAFMVDEICLDKHDIFSKACVLISPRDIYNSLVKSDCVSTLWKAGTSDVRDEWGHVELMTGTPSEHCECLMSHGCSDILGQTVIC